MKRKCKILLAVFLAIIFIAMPITTEVLAYFDRGPVGISVGRSSVSVPAGKSVTVSVSLSPAEDKQLPGCGMEECPQKCGEKGCLDENGQCVCAGTNEIPFATSVSTASSNASVATATYQNGSVTIEGKSEGEAEITLTASLRQFTNSSAIIKVKVTKAEQSTQKPQETTTAQQSDGNGRVITKNVNDSTTSDSNKETSSNSGNETEGEQSQSESAPETTGEEETQKTVNSDRGLIVFTSVKDGKMGKAQLEEIQGKREYVNFQKSDEAGNLLYVWEFFGEDLKDVFDFNMEINIGNTPFSGFDLETVDKTVFLSFEHKGDLPGKASVYLRVSDWLQDGNTVNLYYYDEEKKQPELLKEGLTVENNYLTIEIEHCSKYILGNLDITQKDSSNPMIYIIIIGGALVLAGAAALFFLKKKKRVEGEFYD